jgi:hypothetical protein
MRRVGRSRSERVDLLARPWWNEGSVESGCTALIVDPVEQLRELADLVDRGLLTVEELEHQRRKVFGP